MSTPLYSLVHLTDISCPPPEFIRTAKRAGYDAVSLRTIPMNLEGEIPFDIAKDKQLFKETKRALDETGIIFNDTENAVIRDNLDVREYEPALEAAAELGVKFLLSGIWSTDYNYVVEKFGELCDLAKQYDMRVSVEPVSWACMRDVATTAKMITETGRDNVGIVIDVLHFFRSRNELSVFDGLPKEWFNYTHLCDQIGIPETDEELLHDGRSERLYPGEGEIPIKNIIGRIPWVTRGIEVPHDRRLAELGFEEHARRMLLDAKRVMGE